MIKPCLPVFSGNVNDYRVNYILELDIIKRLSMLDERISLGNSPKNGRKP